MLCCLQAYFPFYLYLDQIVDLKYLDKHWSQQSISFSVSTSSPKNKNCNILTKNFNLEEVSTKFIFKIFTKLLQ